jgi:hypothetical protein
MAQNMQHQPYGRGRSINRPLGSTRAGLEIGLQSKAHNSRPIALGVHAPASRRLTTETQRHRECNLIEFVSSSCDFIPVLQFAVCLCGSRENSSRLAAPWRALGGDVLGTLGTH